MTTKQHNTSSVSGDGFEYLGLENEVFRIYHARRGVLVLWHGFIIVLVKKYWRLQKYSFRNSFKLTSFHILLFAVLWIVLYHAQVHKLKHMYFQLINSNNLTPNLFFLLLRSLANFLCSVTKVFSILKW